MPENEPAMSPDDVEEVVEEAELAAQQPQSECLPSERLITRDIVGSLGLDVGVKVGVKVPDCAVYIGKIRVHSHFYMVRCRKFRNDLGLFLKSYSFLSNQYYSTGKSPALRSQVKANASLLFLYDQFWN